MEVTFVDNSTSGAEPVLHLVLDDITTSRARPMSHNSSN